MTVTTRFAPAPSGRLHAGNIRTAILNWLFARALGGRFLLRLDDTDRARSTPEAAQAIREDLGWLGLQPDGEAQQSVRFARYEAALTRLAAAGRAYPAYETPEELELKRRLQHSRGLPPVYDRAALKLTDADRAQLEAEGRRPHWRFKLDTAERVRWDDLIRGDTHVDPASLSDPVVRREDGSWLYMLPSVVDDIELGITHVIRGEDHVPNSAVQLQMFAALCAPAPAMAHAALLTGAEGALSKRLGSLGVPAFREEGIEPMAVVAYLARLGSADPIEPFTDPGPLIASFDLGRLSRAPARFDLEELKALSAKIIHHLPHEAVAHRLPEAIGAAAWEAIRGNLTRIDEAAEWARVLDGDLPPPPLPPEDAVYAATALATLPPAPLGPDSWGAWTAALKAETGRKGRALFLPLRLALTGREHGPEMAALLPLIGHQRAARRLAAAVGSRGGGGDAI
ncbi:MAG: glutamate--tRNA ligase [Sphingomonadaceae bacterium]|nr:glutamate--tRNA ligase [Sphingomonadaceae bacterium]